MINITLADGKVLQCAESITGVQLALQISSSLAKKALAISIDGVLYDLNTEITHDSHIKIITAQDKDGLEIIRHDAAHVLAQAVKTLYPTAQITIGPVIENGFYYDISLEDSMSIDDLSKIEQEMHKIADSNYAIVKEVWDRNEAIKYFKDLGENYKAEIISDIPEKEKITLYRQGDFVDLCRGPHSPTTKFVKHFKLLKLAGAYWRGDSNNAMLQRIYGTAWSTKEELDAYLLQIEEAERRDHRKIGKELDLFHIQEETPGMIFWHHNGWTIFRILQAYIREKILKRGYIEVNTPAIVDKSLWEKSGHWEKFKENMFVINDEDKSFAVKPMNCPCHIEIFKTKLHSYKELPIRMAEFGSCFRNEPSGSLHGLMRVRNFVQDDAHIFCTEDQITSETVSFCHLLIEVYNELGFKKIKVKFSDRPKVRAGSDETWDKAELALKDAIIAAGFEFEINSGEGAFYGPKIEFVLQDAIGREWQCGTLQVDFVLPERLQANYIAHDGSKRHPVILHRALLGSFERFIGILIENHAGHFPLWLAPIQVVVLTITNDIDEYGEKVAQYLKDKNYRCELDNSSEKINYKVRKYSLLKVPVFVILGRTERDDESISIREFGSNQQSSYRDIKEFESYLHNKLINKE